MKTSQTAPVNIGGRVYSLTSDDDYLKEIGTEFEPHMVHLFAALRSGWRVALDIGANIGCTALLFAGQARTVYAFEPAPSTFAFLQENIHRSEHRNIHLLNVGIGEVEKSTTLTFNPLHRGGAFVSDLTHVTAGHATERILIRPLDSVVTELGLSDVDFIKIDVEGFEAHVLRGATQTLQRWRPTVVMELNHWCLNAFQRTSIPDFIDLVLSLFPHVVAVDGNNYLDLRDANQRYAVMYHQHHSHAIS